MANEKYIMITDDIRQSKTYNCKGIKDIYIPCYATTIGTEYFAAKVKDRTLYVTVKINIGGDDLKDVTFTFKNYNNVKNVYCKKDGVEKAIKIENYDATNSYYDEVMAIIPDIDDVDKSGSSSVSGSVWDDTINVMNSTYVPKSAKAKKNNTGVNIKSYDGDDEITGTKYNDTITGGKGENTVILASSEDGFGDDIVNLTKSEILNIELDNVEITGYKQGKSKNDLLVETDNGSVTIKNYYGKETNATVNIAGHNLVKEVGFLGEINAETYFDKDLNKPVNTYTGTALADKVDASEVVQRSKKGQLVDTGVTIRTGLGDDVIKGSNFADTIKGGAGDDTIEGGEGADNLYGEDGENTFVFNKGDGNDFIYGGKGTDTLRFDDTVITDLEFTKGGKTDLVIGYNHKTVEDKSVAQDTITVKSFFNKRGLPNSSVKYVEFDGKKYEIKDFLNTENLINNSTNTTVNGTEKDDLIITTSNTNQNIYAGKGNDVIYASDNYAGHYINAGDGDDVIYGSNYKTNSQQGNYYTGSGNNTVYAGDYCTQYIHLGSGNDTVYTSTDASYELENGNYKSAQNQIWIDDGGHDTIYWQGSTSVVLRFNSYTKNDLLLTRDVKSNDLVIRYGNDNSVTLKDYYKSGNEGMANFQIATNNSVDWETISEALEYQNGVKIQIKGVKGTVNNDYIQGTDKKETITGNNGNDLINPQGGDDKINLGEGNDTLMAGVGNKEITAVSGNNKIALGSGNNVVYAGTGSDTVISGSGVNNIEFLADDTVNDKYIYGAGTDTIVLNGDKLIDLSVNAQMNDIVLTQKNEKTITLSGLDNLKEGLMIKDSTGATSSLFDLNTTIGAETADHVQTLVTGNGNDTLYSGLRSDTINAGSGVNKINLVVAASGNNNTYTYANGSDTFIVKDAEDFDSLVFHKDNDDLIVGYNSDVANNTVKILGYFASAAMKENLFMKAGEAEAVTIASLLEEKEYSETISCTEDNHTIDASEATKPVTIVGCENADVITGTANNDYINGNGGGDTLMGGAGSDTYIIDSTAYGIAQDIINDTAGNIDKLLLGVNDGESNAFFYVTLNKEDDEVVMNGLNATYTTGADLYINKSSDYTFANATTSNGVKIENYFTEDGKIEQIRNEDDTSDIFENRQIGAIGQTVANWLYKNGYDSVMDVLDNSQEKDEDAIAADKAALLRLYKPTVSRQTYINGSDNGDLILASANAPQTVYAKGGDDVIYASDRYAGQYIDAGNGDDVIYGSNYKTNSGQGEYHTGSGNNIVYAGDYCTKYIHLGNGDDTVYTSTGAKFELPNGYLFGGQNQIWIDGYGFTDGGHDTVYWQGAASVTMRLGSYTKDDLYLTRTAESDDLVIRYGADSTITMKDYYKAGNEKMADYIQMVTNNSSEWNTLATLLENQGGVMNYITGANPLNGTAPYHVNDYLVGSNNAETIRPLGGTLDYIDAKGGNDTIYITSWGNHIINCGAGSDYLYLGAANEDQTTLTVYTNSKYGGKDTTIGTNDAINFSALNTDNTVYAQSYINTITGGNGDDNYFAYVDQKTSITDAAGSDTLTLTDTTTDLADGVKANLHVLFNVAADYDYDSEDVNTLFNGDVFITGTETKANYDLWTSNGAYAGVSVTGNTVENIKSSDGYTLTNTKISELASSVAGWLTTNGYENVDGVFSNALGKLDNESAADITALIAVFDAASWA